MEGHDFPENVFYDQHLMRYQIIENVARRFTMSCIIGAVASDAFCTLQTLERNISGEECNARVITAFGVYAK